MAHSKEPAVVKDELQNLLRGFAKNLNQRIYGDQGIPWGTKFADIEELAVQIGQEISRGMIEQGVARQADDVPPEAESCGGCGVPVKPTDHAEPKAVTTRVGPAQWNQPKRYCPKCRAAFFPSGSRTRD